MPERQKRPGIRQRKLFKRFALNRLTPHGGHLAPQKQKDRQGDNGIDND